jgi:hypothetical protein
MKDAEQFALYIHTSRNEFVKKFWEEYPNAKQRVMAEDLLICFDQMHERIINYEKQLVIDKNSLK